MTKRLRIRVINGPNLNLLGLREVELYGRQDYRALEKVVAAAGEEYGVQTWCFQSNHEGEIVDYIQRCHGKADGLVINPAAYTHTSIAILDALKAVSLPAVEVHISKLEHREDFRQRSYAGMACIHTITGQGLAGYRLAIGYLASHLRKGAALG